MNAQNDSDLVVKVYRKDTNAPGKDTRSSGTVTPGYVKMPGTLNENSHFSERIDDTAHMQGERVSTGTNGEISARKETKNRPERAVIHWGDREYDIDEFRALLLKSPGDVRTDHDGITQGKE